MPVDLLLIHPPVVRPSEPPLGIASLTGYLREQGLNVEMLDLNVEAFHHLLSPEGLFADALDAFSRRSLRRLPAGLEEIRSSAILRDPARYRSTVRHLERVLWLRSHGDGRPRVSFTDFIHPGLSPLRSEDLDRMARLDKGDPLHEFIAHRAVRFVRQIDPRWVGISLNYLSQALPAMAVAGSLRRAFPDKKIVMGGSLVTLWEPRLRRGGPLSSWADHWIPGPGEAPLARLLEGRSLPSRGPWPPDFQGVPWDLYLSPERIVPISAARGCYWGRCRFCPEGVCGDRFQPMSPRYLRKTLAGAVERYGARWVHWTDNALSPRILKSISDSAWGAQWFGFARFQSQLRDPTFVRQLRHSGCRMLQLGLESGSQRILDAMEKGIDLTEVSRILEVLHGEGIGTYVYVMFGMPGETREDACLTLSFVARHAPWIDYLNCAILNLPRGLEDAHEVETFPFSDADRDLSLYTDFRHPDGMDRREARRFLQGEFKRHPAITPILRRDPPAFTSSHAALFL
jgi:hypothetical protein